MSVKETYLAALRYGKKDPSATYIMVARKVNPGNPLVPSAKLLADWKGGSITWDQYTERYKEELNNEIAQKYLRELKELSKTKDIYLVCYEKNPPCHRFILLEILNNMP